MSSFIKVSLIVIVFSITFISINYGQDTSLINYKGRLIEFKLIEKSPSKYPKLIMSAGLGIEKRPYTDYIFMKSISISYNYKNKVQTKLYYAGPVANIFDIQYYNANNYSVSDNDLVPFYNYGGDATLNLIRKNKESFVRLFIANDKQDDLKIKLVKEINTSRLHSLGLIGGGFHENSVILHIGNHMYSGIYRLPKHVNYGHTVIKAGLNYSISTFILGELVNLKKVETIRKIELFVIGFYAVNQNLEDIIILEDSTFYFAYAPEIYVSAGLYPLAGAVNFEYTNYGLSLGLRYQDLNFNNNGYSVELSCGSYPGLHFIDGKQDYFFQFRLTYDLGFLN